MLTQIAASSVGGGVNIPSVAPMLPIFVAVVVAAIGLLIFWSNTDRMVNRVVFTCSVHIGIWLTLLYLTAPPNGLFWLRWACSVSAFVPFHFWIVKESIVTNLAGSIGHWIGRSWGWILITTVIAIIPFTEFFMPSFSSAANRAKGPGYYAYMVVVLTLYAYIFFDAVRSIKTLIGGRKLELQVWLMGGCAMTLTVLGLMALNAVTHDRTYIRLQPVVVLMFYAGTMLAITTYRIFDARQILLVAIEKFTLVAVVAATAYFLDLVLQLLLAEPFAFIATTAIALWWAATFSGWLDRLFKFYPQATTARQAAFEVARRESRVENLERAFLGVLKGWGQSDHALMLSGDKEVLRNTAGTEISHDSVALKALRQLRWATPERLAREKSTPDREALSKFLGQHDLGVVVISEGPTMGALVGVGVTASRRPFTYPQVAQLMELGSIIESALERAHFSVKAQHAEQLATVGLLGASLAHEIRNPLVSIKTFVQLLPTHHQDPVFREKFFRLISDEVSRIDQLTEQLLDLASPRAYLAEDIELHPVLRASLDLVAAKASHRSIQFITDFQAAPDRAFTDASAAKQVILNLCFNAIQAVEPCPESERWVKIATRNMPAGIEMAVTDNGPGITAEIRPRLFQPFQTTKSTGFGLGLAICSDILANLNASITVDEPQPGCGATFRVTFPCQPLSS